MTGLLFVQSSINLHKELAGEFFKAKTRRTEKRVIHASCHALTSEVENLPKDSGVCFLFLRFFRMESWRVHELV